MKADFDKALAVELKYEGGKDDDPVDPGGRTNQGIIQRVFTAWLRKNGKPNRDVFTMTNAERDQIYRENYFAKVRFDELPPGVDIVVVDGAINSGPAQSIKWVQRALGLTADGVLGDVTMERIQSHPDHDLLIRDILNRRREFLRALKTFWHFGSGWMARVDNLQKVGQAWAMGSVGPAVVFFPNGNKKANIVDAKPLPVKAVGDALGAGGTVTTGLTTAQQTLAPLSGTSPAIDRIIMILLVLGIVATAAGFAWAWWARRREAIIIEALDLNPQAATPANNDNLPPEVLEQYVDPAAQGAETGNIAPGHTTTSGRVAGDGEIAVSKLTGKTAA
jgi:lysozyme family protein